VRIIIIEESLVELEALSGNAQQDLSDYIHAIDAAPSIKSLESLLKDDVVKTGNNEFHILVKDNYQHVAACIKVKVRNKNEALITFQSYD
jgi:hypothetical protein